MIPDIMKLKLTTHFQARMNERNINLDHVKSAMKNPDSKKSAYDNKMKVKKKVGNKTIEVIYCKEGFKDRKEEYLLITAYYL